MKTASLSELAALVGGQLVGDGTRVVNDVAPLHAAGENDISFLLPGHKAGQLDRSQAGAVVVPTGFTSEHCPLIQADDVSGAFEKITLFFRPVRSIRIGGIADSASVAKTAKLGCDVGIGHGAVIGDDVTLGDRVEIFPGVVILAGSTIGSDTKIFPNAVLYENTVVGKNCIIHAGVVLGAYGFGYDSSSGRHILSVQYGNVVLGDEVDVGACTTIDRGTFGSTRIGNGTKIDNQVMIGHNCVIGRNNLICAHAGIAGSVKTGDYVVMGGQVGLRDHIEIGDRVVLGAMAGVMGDIPAGSRFVGIPATPEKEQMKKQVALAKLPEMRKEFKEVQTRLAQLIERSEKEKD